MNKILAKNIRVKVSNPDSALVYLLYHMQFWDQQEREIFIECGDINKNTAQQINVRTIFKTLTSSMVNALPSWHVFTGCLYEPSFYGKGKKTCMKLLERNVPAQLAFARIGNGLAINENDVAVLEEFTCSLYNQKGGNVNQARSNIFQKTYEHGADLRKRGILFFKNNRTSNSIDLNTKMIEIPE